MIFRTGQKVVCVDDLAPKFGWLGPPLHRGQIYTIRLARINPLGNYGVLLNEIRTERPFPDGSERGYLAYRFRPLTKRKADISIFTRMLDDARSKDTCNVDR
jgi:hypothetical protein